MKDGGTLELKLSGSVQCCFTSTETVGVFGEGSPGRPPRLSHTAPELCVS